MSAYVHGWELWYGSSGRQESDAYGDFENSEHLCGWRSSPLGFATIIKRWQRPQDYIVLAKKSLQDEDFFAVWITIWIEPPYAERHVRWCERGYLLAPTRLRRDKSEDLFTEKTWHTYWKQKGISVKYPVFDSFLSKKVSQPAILKACETFVIFTITRYIIYFFI